jgi:hypothetical protein
VTEPISDGGVAGAWQGRRDQGWWWLGLAFRPEPLCSETNGNTYVVGPIVPVARVSVSPGT